MSGKSSPRSSRSIRRKVQRETTREYIKRASPYVAGPVALVALGITEWARRKYAKQSEEQRLANEIAREEALARGEVEPVFAGPGQYTNTFLLGAEVIFAMVAISGIWYSAQTINESCNITPSVATTVESEQ